MGDGHRMRRDEFRVELFVFPDGTSVELMVFDRERGGSGGARRAPHRTPQRHADATTSPAARGGSDEAPCSRADPAPPSPVTGTAAEAQSCPICHGNLVYPVDWRREADATWRLRLRCPECETQRDVLLDRRAMEQLNRELYAAHRMMTEASRDLARRNFEEAAERIVAALDSGLIQPMDF